MWLMTVRCHSCEPWHMLRRATFMPLAASVASASFEHDAGPIVQISFVLRVLRGPVTHESITLVYVRSSLTHQRPQRGVQINLSLTTRRITRRARMMVLPRARSCAWRCLHQRHAADPAQIA